MSDHRQKVAWSSDGALSWTNRSRANYHSASMKQTVGGNPDPDPDLIEVSDSRETAAALARSAGRKSSSTPIRRSFVQPGDRSAQRMGGPLADIVRRRDLRGLVLYLMVLTLASKDPWNVCRDSRIWARLLDLSDTPEGRAIVSKVLRRLRNMDLVSVERRGRLADITVLSEDGTGVDYSYPTTNQADRYLRLPEEFWTEGWYQQLDLPGMAMLLVLLSEKDGVVLPVDRIPDWYGISRATAQRGFTELQKKDLVTVWMTPRKAPLLPAGYTIDKHYRLTGDFARKPRSSTNPDVDTMISSLSTGLEKS